MRPLCCGEIRTMRPLFCVCKALYYGSKERFYEVDGDNSGESNNELGHEVLLLF